MTLKKLKYSEHDATPRAWGIQEAIFSNINLIVGKNSSGKSRLLSVVHGLTNILSGRQKNLFDSGFFEAEIETKSQNFVYEIKFENQKVFYERLRHNGKEVLTRDSEGRGRIFYQGLGQEIDFKSPPDAIAAVNRRDEIQHPFLMTLYQWAESCAIYHFGTDFGRRELAGVAEPDELFSPGDDSIGTHYSNVIKAFVSGQKKHGDAFINSIIKDMGRLDYHLDMIEATNVQGLLKTPTPAVGLFTVEKELGFKLPQMQLSQGMYRALALIIHINYVHFTNKKALILIDDIGEGLDYERSVEIIDLIIEKSREDGLQLIMTSNDRFVMNRVPLEYWSIIKRNGNNVKLFNKNNSEEKFKQFEYIGLNNFDFFASEFFEDESDNA